MLPERRACANIDCPSWIFDQGSFDLQCYIALEPDQPMQQNRDRDHWADTEDRHNIDAVFFPLADLFNLIGNGFNPVIKPKAVSIETKQDFAHPGRYLIFALLQNGFE